MHEENYIKFCWCCSKCIFTIAESIVHKRITIDLNLNDNIQPSENENINHIDQ